MITIEDKKDFLRWFLNHYQLKRRESVWILNYLMSQDKMIDNIHFVDNVKVCPRGLMISSHCVDDKPFYYYKEGMTITDAEKAFHDIRLNREEVIYIQLNFYNKYHFPQYANVLENNPFEKNSEINSDVSKEVEDFLQHSLQLFQKNFLLNKIDEALDKRDSVNFFKYSQEYINLNKSRS